MCFNCSQEHIELGENEENNENVVRVNEKQKKWTFKASTGLDSQTVSPLNYMKFVMRQTIRYDTESKYDGYGFWYAQDLLGNSTPQASLICF
jgi:hypothetical protein